jgi:hypothetical protein
VLTFRCARAVLAFYAARIGAIAALSAMTFMPAQADKLIVGGCTGSWGSFNCVARIGVATDPYVRQVPQPETEAEKTRATARDHRWIDRCRPVITQDRLGVPRYHYSAPGCEFGVLQ